jgi:hypothetical protein
LKAKGNKKRFSLIQQTISFVKVPQLIINCQILFDFVPKEFFATKSTKTLSDLQQNILKAVVFLVALGKGHPMNLT